MCCSVTVVYNIPELSIHRTNCGMVRTVVISILKYSLCKALLYITVFMMCIMVCITIKRGDRFSVTTTISRFTYVFPLVHYYMFRSLRTIIR
jgi:hypothetical protein